MNKKCEKCGQPGNLIGKTVKNPRLPAKIMMICEKCNKSKKG